MKIVTNFDFYDELSWRGGKIKASASSLWRAVSLIKEIHVGEVIELGDLRIERFTTEVFDSVFLTGLIELEGVAKGGVEVHAADVEEFADFLREECEEKIREQIGDLPQRNSASQETLSVATHNISVCDCGLQEFISESGFPSVVFLQECSWNSRDFRSMLMRCLGYVLLGQTRGGLRESNVNNLCEKKCQSAGENYVCLETYIHQDAVKDLVPKNHDFRTSNCAHEVLLDSNNLANKKKRHHFLACKVWFGGEAVWVINVHLPAGDVIDVVGSKNINEYKNKGFEKRDKRMVGEKRRIENGERWTISWDGRGFAMSSDYRWRCLRELDEWYKGKAVIAAGDWNFDARAAFEGEDVFGLPPSKFYFAPPHQGPIGLCDELNFTKVGPTFHHGGVGCRVDFVAACNKYEIENPGLGGDANPPGMHAYVWAEISRKNEV